MSPLQPLAGSRNKSEQQESERQRNNSGRWAVNVRVGLGLVILVFAVLSYDDDYRRWWYMSLGIGSAILALQFTRLRLLSTCALWVGGFWILQSLVSLAVVDPQFVTLLPNQSYLLDVKGGLPGIEGVQRYTTDKLGFRTTKAIDYGHDKALRVFVIGGSTTEQLWVDDHRTFTHLLQEALQDRFGSEAEVVNTGVAGTRALQHIATLKKIQHMHPDLVLILLGVNDWNRHIHLNFPGAPVTVKASVLPEWQFGIRPRNTLLMRALAALQMAVRTSRNRADDPEERVTHGEYFTSQNDSLRRPLIKQFRPLQVSDEYAAHLAELFALCKASTAPCLFVTQPSAYQTDAPEAARRQFWMTPPNTEYTLDFESMLHIARLYNNYLRTQAAQQEIPVCDIAVGMLPTSAHFYDDVHFNTGGAGRVAELLIPCVMRLLDDRAALIVR